MQGLVGAGAKAGPGLRELGVERVPLLRIGGETILERACRCLQEGGGCGKVFVMAPEEVPLPGRDGMERGHYTGAFVHDCLECIRTRMEGDYLIFAAGDVPLITPESVAAVAAAGRETGADIIYPVISRENMEQMFPGGKRTYVPLKDGRFTGGNVFWVNRGWIVEREPMLRELFDRRKDVLGLARMFGFDMVLRLLFGQADLAFLETRLAGILKGHLRALPLDLPEIGADLDKVADLELFRDCLDPWD